MSNIRLFTADDTVFTGLGLGKITDAISCQVTEERNGSFELEMEYPVTGIRYSQLALRMLIVAPPNPYDNPQAFRIYSISKAYGGKVTVKAQHISYDLSDTIIKSASVNNDNLTPAMIYNAVNNAAVINKSSFTFTTDVTVSDSMDDGDGNKLTNWVLKGPKSLRNVLLGNGEDAINKNYISSTNTGDEPEFYFDNFSIKFLKNRGENRGVTIRYGKNMKGFSQEESFENLYTHVYPFYYASSITYYEGGYAYGTQRTVENWTVDLSAYTGTSYTTFPFLDTGLRDDDGNPFNFRHILALDVSSLYKGDYEIKFEDPSGLAYYTTYTNDESHYHQVSVFYEGYFNEDIDEIESWGDEIVYHDVNRKQGNKTVGKDETIMAVFHTYWIWNRNHNASLNKYKVDNGDILNNYYDPSHYTFKLGGLDLKAELYRVLVTKRTESDAQGHITDQQDIFYIYAKLSREDEPESGGDYKLIWSQDLQDPGTRGGLVGDDELIPGKSYYFDINNPEDVKRGAILIEKAGKRYIQENRMSRFPVQLSVTLDYAEKTEVKSLYDIRLCDIITVIYPSFNVSTLAKCTKTVYDCISEKYTKLDFSNAWSSFSFKTSKSIDSTIRYNQMNTNYLPNNLSYLNFLMLTGR